MKNLMYILLIPVLTAVPFSCSEDIMDEINENKNNPTDVDSKLIITELMTNTAFAVVGSDLAFYSSVYVEHNVGIYGQLYNAEIRSGEPISSTTYNNSWNAIYNNLYNAKVIIEKCSEGGDEEDNYHTLGIAQILAAYNLGVLTDLFGDVPWSEALQPGIIFTPVIDRQEDIYESIFNYLDNAIENLGRETTFPSLGNQDFIYGGDETLWLKTAYGLKARYLMHQSARSPRYAEVISNVDNSYESSDEQCQFSYNGSTSKSPFYSFFNDRDYFGASQGFHDKLVARNDPRDELFFIVHPDAEDEVNLLFAPNGTPTQVQNLYSVSAISSIDAPTYLLSYHELQFLKAEAYARLGETANSENALKEAISAAFQKVNIGLTAADASDYYENRVRSRFNANPLSEVMIQKYLAFFEEEAVEAYNDIRRLIAMGNGNIIELRNPLNSSRFPLRFTYGASDVTTNFNVANAYGDGNYVYNENVWWAGGTR